MSGPNQAGAACLMSDKIQLEDFFVYWTGEKCQREGVALLSQTMPHSLMSDESAWVKAYRNQLPAQQDQPEPEPDPGPTVSNPLDVPYFWQQDNGPDGWRQCQTSSIAMCLAYMGVPGINDDVDYLRIVQKYGDTTNQCSHQQALKELGVPAKFKTNGNKADLIRCIKANKPVPMGILHHGNVSNPSGGGHYIVLIGWTDESESGKTICHDPYGDLDLISGNWCSTGPTSGKSIQYSWKNLLPRWDLNNGIEDGWYWELG